MATKQKNVRHKLKKFKRGEFLVATLGIIFKTNDRKILIGKRVNDPYTKILSWSFPGGFPEYNEDLEKSLEKRIKQKTGLTVKNLGCVFSRIFRENKKILLLYYLCEVIGGKEAPKDDLVELKWVKPEELEKHFTTSFDKRLEEYIMNLR